MSYNICNWRSFPLHLQSSCIGFQQMNIRRIGQSNDGWFSAVCIQIKIHFWKYTYPNLKMNTNKQTNDLSKKLYSD